MTAQILAVSIFVIMFLLIIIDKIERQYITLGCGLLTLVLVFGLCMHDTGAIVSTLNLHSIFKPDFWYAAENAAETSQGINWATIIFIAGMMIMVEGMARTGFFRWLCMRIANFVHYKPIPIFLSFMVMSAVALICGMILVQFPQQLFGSNLTDSELKTAQILMTILVVNIALTFPASLLDSIISAHEKFLFQRIVTLVGVICNPLLALY